MRNYKRFTSFFLLFLFIIPIYGIFNYIVDPLQQYRVNTFYPLYFYKERYQNAGFSKNFDYDSIILGTSMTENFVLNEVEEKLGFKRTIKLSISGGSAYEQSITLQTAILNNIELKSVLWGLDLFSFAGEPKNLPKGKGSFPFYLYDNNFFNDYRYLLSVDILNDSLEAITRKKEKIKNDIKFDMNRMYEWQHKHNNSFTIERFKKSWLERDNAFFKEHIDKQTFKYLKESFDFNFLSVIKNNPQINFKIFFPPYSILTHKVLEERKILIDMLKFKKYLFETLTLFSNVELYDFQIKKETTHFFKNYKDLTHYHQKVNTLILDDIKKEHYKMTHESIEELYDQVKNYNTDFKY